MNLMSIGNFFMVAAARVPFLGARMKDLAVIEYTGSKTGKRRAVPVNGIWIGPALYVTSMRNRKWWRSLRDGREVTVRNAGRTFHLHGRVLESTDAVAEGLREYVTARPAYARYFQVGLDAKGLPKPEDLRRIAGEKVVVQFR